MTAHDPLCPYSKPEQDRDPNDYCGCDLIARARADEREQIIRSIELRADAWRRDGYLNEADDLLSARQIVLARGEQS